MQKRNYQKEMEKIIESFDKEQTPSLLLHSCCAPCSSYCLEYLSQYFKITVFYYNPNIYPEEEYQMRVREQQDFIRRFPFDNPVDFVEGTYDTERFYATVKGLEKVKEGGERCFACYRLRLTEAFEAADRLHMDYVTTTLSISPLKKADQLNAIGEELAKSYRADYLVSDFKKKNGYKRSVEITSEYGMYRQDYCGCVFSMRERQNKTF